MTISMDIGSCHSYCFRMGSGIRLFAYPVTYLGRRWVSIDGFECAGLLGEDDVVLIVLLPATVDALPNTPNVASGGMADGRGLLAALALGADAVNMGTRFCATVEAKIHDNLKKQIVANNELDTVLVGRRLRNTARVAKNAVSLEVAQIQTDPIRSFEDVKELMSGARARERILAQGNVDGGILTTGQSQALIHDIPTCSELVANIMAQAAGSLHRLHTSSSS